MKIVLFSFLCATSIVFITSTSFSAQSSSKLTENFRERLHNIQSHIVNIDAASDAALEEARKRHAAEVNACYYKATSEKASATSRCMNFKPIDMLCLGMAESKYSADIFVCNGMAANPPG